MKYFNKPEVIFLILGFIFGVLMLFITPPFKVPDEMSHLSRACEVSSGIFYNALPSEINKCDQKLISANLSSKKNSGEFHTASGYSPLMYMASGLGLKVFSSFDGKIMFYAGRFFNLFIWLALIYAAIKITPVFKWPLMFCALFPMNVYEGMSYSADSFNNAFAFLFFAYIFKLIFSSREPDKKNILTFIIMSILGALCKGLIYPIFFYIFVKDKWRRKISILLTALLISISISVIWQKINYIHIPDIYSFQQNSLLLKYNTLSFLFIFLKTIIINSAFYMRGIIGILGLLNIHLIVKIYILTMLIFFLNFFVFTENKITNYQRILAIIITLWVILSTHILLFLIWTPTGSYKIIGVQGRYFISCIPLFCLIFAQKGEGFFLQKPKFLKFYKIFLIFYIVLLLGFSNWLIYFLPGSLMVLF